MTYDLETDNYGAKRRAEGKTDREIRLCLTRYLTRRIFKIFNTQVALHQPAGQR